jgi:hypothetical protein
MEYRVIDATLQEENMDGGNRRWGGSAPIIAPAAAADKKILHKAGSAD